MANSNKNICLRSIIPIIFVIMLSGVMHIFFIILLIYSVFDSVGQVSTYNTQNCGIQTFLIPINNIIVDNKKSYDNCFQNKSQSVNKTKNVISTQVFTDEHVSRNVNKIESNITNFENNVIVQNDIVNDIQDIDFESSKAIVTNSLDVVDIGIRRPNIIKCVYPEYPRVAKALRIEGQVAVMYNINNIGKVEKIRIISSIPPGIFEKNIKIAMRRWIYEINNVKKDLIIVFKFSVNTVHMMENLKQ